jgi:predicted helicase
MRALEMLNSNDIGGAKKHLEMDLDTKIIEHWNGLVNKPWSFSLLPQNEDATNKLMAKVVAYRKMTPSITNEPQVKEAIETVINRYQK